MKQTKTQRMTNFKIEQLKKRAIDLKISNQITSHMCGLIFNCSYDDVDYVKFLTQLFEHYLRVRGYYKKHKDIAELTDKAIDEAIEKFYLGRRNI